MSKTANLANVIAVFAGQTLVLTGVETRSGPNGRT